MNKLSAGQGLSCEWKDYLQIEVQSANPRFMCRSKFNLQMEEVFADKSTICISKNDLQMTDMTGEWLLSNSGRPFSV